MTGEQHERAVEAIATEFCPREGGACRRCRERACKALAEQGVRLVDLREVVAAVTTNDTFDVAWRQASQLEFGKHSPARLTAALNAVADALERRFGGNERSE